MKNFNIQDVCTGEVICNIQAETSSSALNKFWSSRISNGSSGFSSLVFRDGEWKLGTAYGDFYRAFEQKGA